MVKKARAPQALVRARTARDERTGFFLGLLTLATIVALDLLVGDEATSLIGPLVVAPFLTALLAGPVRTAAIGALALALAVASPIWNVETQAGADFYVKVAVIALGSVFAAITARNRARAAERADRLRLLDAVGEVADGSLPLAETLRRVVDVTVPIAGDICIIDSVHEGRATRLAVGAAGRPDSREIEERFRRRRPSLPSWLVEVERSWRLIPRWLPRMAEEDVRRMAQSEEDLEFLRELGIRSLVIVPIAARERNLGALSLINAWSGRRYRADDVQFAQNLAGRVALALDNAGLFSDLESFERRMDTVMSIVDEAVVITSRDGEILFANPAAARMLGFESTEDAMGPVARLRERFAIRDERGRDLGPEALVGSEIFERDDVTPPTLRLLRRESQGEAWCRVRSQPIRGPAGEVLYAVSVIEDVTDVKQAEFRQRVIARTTELLAHTTEYAATAESAARLMVPEFADSCTVSVGRTDGTIEQVALADRDPERERRRQGPTAYTIDADTPVAEVIRTGEPVLIRSTDEETLRRVAVDEEHLALLRSLDYGSLLIVPMATGEGVAGAIAFSNRRGSRAFDESDLHIAVEIGRRAGLAIESARIADERARIAGLLQRELLPRQLPAVPGWEIETMYEPAGELEEVGGDFYEVFRVEGGWAIVLGDVSGHGAAAASLTAEARHTIRTAGVVSGDASTGLRILDRNLRGRRDAALCSVALLVLPDTDGEDRAISVYLAGHPHPLLVSAGTVEELGEPGPALGVAENPSWGAVRATVRDGEIVLLYTDGVLDARRPDGERFGLERLRASVAGCETAEAAIARVRAEMEAFLVSEPADDVALVVLRRSDSVELARGRAGAAVERAGAGAA